MDERVAAAVRVEGTVQGVGFRPFVYSLATRLRLGGHVGNDAAGVFAEVEGDRAAVQEFLAALTREAPPLASIDKIVTREISPNGAVTFSIVPSAAGGARRALVPADTATCADCLRELAGPADRRFGYPFINCTNCGPRFTIIRGVPYDRPLTTMAGFEMCAACEAEYHDPANRRFHAQPTCCPACGPTIRLLAPDGTPHAAGLSPPAGTLPPGSPPPVDVTTSAIESGGCDSDVQRERDVAADLSAGAPPPGSPPPVDVTTSAIESGGCDSDVMGRRSGAAAERALAAAPEQAALERAALERAALERAALGNPAIAGAAALLRAGRIVAVKGLGGYHLAVDAANEAAAATLRSRKHREDKPFAVMVTGLAEARELCEVDDAGAGLLTGPARPIVLLPRLPGAGVAAAVAPGNRDLGIMLPYTPLHHLLLAAVAGPMVLTSGNVSDEPIAYTDEDALARLAGIADAFLTHDRPIHMRTDDSVVRVRRGRMMPVRRSRGFVPAPIAVRGRFPRPVLACGAELKSTFCLGRDDHAVISHHIGDLENAETLASFTAGIAHFRAVFDFEPQVIAYDLHPEYLSTKHALGLPAARHVGVQHHHAHIASCLADNGEEGPVIGVAFDGTGYGTDGTIWGGEFLIAGLAGFERAGHLAPVPMPGGAAAIRQPWRMAAAYTDAAFPGGPPRPLAVARRHERDWDNVIKIGRRGINSPLTSSAGRLFDAVAALLGVRDAVNYEGQAAIELEQLADLVPDAGYWGSISGTAPFCIQGFELVAAAAEDLSSGVDAAIIAGRFHRGVAGLVERGCLLARDAHGLETVALSGGVFQNVLLLRDCVSRLESRGFRVLVHARVPCNDGGISLGQAAVAGAQDRPPEP